MKQLWIPVALSAALIAGCHERPQQVAGTPMPTVEDHSGHDHEGEDAHATSMPPAAAPSSDQMTGTIVETMDSGGYTYVLLDTNTEKLWVAVPESSAAVGDVVGVNDPMPMPGFKSTTLERTFDMIYFASSLGTPQVDLAEGRNAAPSEGSAVQAAAIEKSEGEQTIEGVFIRSDNLVGKEITVRGTVVKYNEGIMGKNWLHIQDGSGSEGTNDLTITTLGTAAMGDIVTVTGMLVADKDFGFGYKYDLIVEDAEVTVD